MTACRGGFSMPAAPGTRLGEYLRLARLLPVDFS
jgi:hypothetical protein